MEFIGRIASNVTVLHEGSVLAEGPMEQVQDMMSASSKCTWALDHAC